MFLENLQAVQTMIVGDSNKQYEATLGTGNAAFGIGVEENSLIFLCLRNMNLLPTSVCAIARCAVLPVHGHHDDFIHNISLKISQDCCFFFSSNDLLIYAILT